MKHWCPECKSEYVVGEKLTTGYCTMLEDNGEECGEILIELPDFETLAQYEKRTGKKWNGAVWFKYRFFDKKWKAYALDFLDGKKCDYFALCAASPEPPPDDYVPEEINYERKN
ncbi:MAG: hypothetical protein FWB73_00125 [Treponema sp.]|nr:hypothetical protein [Treponema sp.]